MKPLLPLLAVLLALLPACGDGETGAGEVTEYAAELRPLNGSGVTGKAVFELQEDAIGVRISARGFEDKQIISQSITGLAGTKPARCPDGGAGQRRRSYGRTLFYVQPSPTIKPGETRLRYDLTVHLSEAERRRLEPLEGRALVLSGRTAGRGGEVSPGRAGDLPLACGRISRAE